MGFLIRPQRFAVAAPPFAPDDIASIKSWWDFSDSASLSTTGSTINSITNQLVGGTTFSQRGALSLPSLSTLGGTQCALFDASSSECMHVANEAASDVLFGTGDFSWVVTFSTSTLASVRQFIFGKGSSQRYFLGCPREIAPVGDVSVILDGTTTNVTSSGSMTGALDGTPHSIIVTVERSGAGNSAAQSIGYLDNVQVLDSGVVPNIGNIDDTSNNGVDELILAGVSAGINLSQRFFDGRIGELIFYDSVLTSDERNDLQTYLANKWSI